MRRYALMIALSWVLALGAAALQGSPDDLAPNSVVVTIDGKEHRFTGSMAGSVSDIGSGMARVIIALRDEAGGVMLQLSADVPAELKWDELHLDTRYFDISMVYKSRDLQFLIVPTLQMARHRGGPHRRSGEAVTGKGSRRAPEWRTMDRDERIARGRGIVREESLEGSVLFLVQRTVTEAGMTEFRGTFSGVAVIPGEGKARRRVVIRDGKYRVGVRGR